MDANVKVRGDLLITLVDTETGEFKQLTHHNAVVNSGLVWMLDNCVTPATVSISAMAIGAGTQPVGAGDNGLAQELYRSATFATRSGSSLVIDVTFVENAGTGSISELALFLSNGVLFARSVIPAQNKSATTRMQVTWTITLQAS